MARLTKARGAGLACALGGVSAAPATAQEAFELQRVMTYDQRVLGVVPKGVWPHSINERGEAALDVSLLSINKHVLALARDGDVQVIYARGDQVPGIDSSLGWPQFATVGSDGSVVFRTEFNPATAGQGVFRWDGAGITPVLLPGDTPPGAMQPVQGAIVGAASGAESAWVQGTIGTSSMGFIYQATAQGLTLIASDASVRARLGYEGNIGGALVPSHELAADGTIVMAVSSVGPTAARSELITVSPTSQRIVVRTGEVLAGKRPGEVVPSWAGIRPRIAENGQIAYILSLQSAKYLYADTPGGAWAIARTDDPVPGVPGATWSDLSFDDMRVGPGGHVVFIASVRRSDGEAARGMWIADPSERRVRLVALLGERLLDEFDQPVARLGAWGVDARGAMALTLEIDTAPNVVSRVVASWTARRGLRLLLAPGDGVRFDGREDVVTFVDVARRLDPFTGSFPGNPPRFATRDGRFALSASMRSGVRGLFLARIPGECSDADFNNDGAWPDVVDIAAFFDAFASGDPCAGCDGLDINGDGVWPDAGDLGAFVTLFAGGEC